jgi:hypothetical protein
MAYLICRHIRTNGLQCQAPALTGGCHCYFHDRLHQKHSSFRHTPATRGYLLPGRDIQLNPLEDRESIQVALSVVINALATGQLENKRATALLYGLQIASSNSAKLDWRAHDPTLARTAETTPDGVDLAEPGTIYEPPTFIFDDEEDDVDNEEENQRRPHLESLSSLGVL